LEVGARVGVEPKERSAELVLSSQKFTSGRVKRLDVVAPEGSEWKLPDWHERVAKPFKVWESNPKEKNASLINQDLKTHFVSLSVFGLIT